MCVRFIEVTSNPLFDCFEIVNNWNPAENDEFIIRASDKFGKGAVEEIMSSRIDTGRGGHVAQEIRGTIHGEEHKWVLGNGGNIHGYDGTRPKLDVVIYNSAIAVENIDEIAVAFDSWLENSTTYLNLDKAV